MTPVGRVVKMVTGNFEGMGESCWGCWILQLLAGFSLRMRTVLALGGDGSQGVMFFLWASVHGNGR